MALPCTSELIKGSAELVINLELGSGILIGSFAILETVPRFPDRIELSNEIVTIYRAEASK